MGRPLFYVEQKNNFQVFYYLHNIKPDDNKVFISDKEYKFSELFSVVGKRTGAHIPTCDLLYANFELNDDIEYNFEINKIILNYFACATCHDL